MLGKKLKAKTTNLAGATMATVPIGKEAVETAFIDKQSK